MDDCPIDGSDESNCGKLYLLLYFDIVFIDFFSLIFNLDIARKDYDFLDNLKIML